MQVSLHFLIDLSLCDYPEIIRLSDFVNEKIYVFLWFWFIIVAAISGVSLIYRLLTVFGPQVRMYLLRAKSRLSEPRQIDVIAQKCQIGDWFVLYQLGKNMDPLIYRELIQDLAQRLQGRDTV
ncbi:innexin inx2 [Folsomia candida]|uniref:Innexin n=1 Tax=Folsomia candida TaxID=158441 RepID=A0A226EJU4_FOLCA|nr:innexin inx2 [Folsomia candida]OXA57274.1 Innexin inx2 [Folsomia candida]